MKWQRVVALNGVGAAALAAVAYLVIAGAGLPQRLPAEAALINAAVGTNYRCPIRITCALEVRAPVR